MNESRVNWLAMTLAAWIGLGGCMHGQGTREEWACDANENANGTAMLSATCNDSELTVSLRNTGKKPILVDRELVFLLSIWPLAQDREFMRSEGESVVPKLPSSSIKDRFVVLSAGDSVRRTIRWNEPYKEFVCGISYPEHAVTAYESYGVFPRKEDISEIEINYGHGYGTREGLDFYLDGAQFLNSVYEGPLKVSLQLKGKRD